MPDDKEPLASLPAAPPSPTSPYVPKNLTATTPGPLWLYVIIVLFVVIVAAGGWMRWSRLILRDDTMRHYVMVGVPRALQTQANAIASRAGALSLIGHTDSHLVISQALQDVPFYIEGMDTPVVVEGLGEAFIEVEMPDGTHTTLPGACAPLFPSLTIGGEWVEEGVHFLVNTATVTDFRPAEVPGAQVPEDVVAYIVTYPLDANGHYPPADEWTTDSQVVALRPDGSTVSLLTESAHRYFETIDPYYSPGMDAIYLVPLSTDFTCPASWFVRYLPGVGVDGAWLVTYDPRMEVPQFVWDHASNRGVVFLDKPATSTTDVWWVTSGEYTVLGVPDATLPSYWSLNLRPGTNEVVVPVNDSEALQHFDLATSEKLATYRMGEHETLAAFAFDPTGRYLVIRTTLLERDLEGNDRSSVRRYNVETGAMVPLWSPDRGRVYNIVPDATGERWYAFTYVPTTRALTLYLLGDAESRPFFTAPADREIPWLLACQSGGAIFVTGMVDSTDIGTRKFGKNPYHLTRVDANGNPLYSNILLPDWATPAMCP